MRGPRRDAAFDLTDAWGAATSPAFSRASERMLERSGDAPRDVLLRVVGPARRATSAGCASASDLAAEGVPPAAAADAHEAQPFYVQKLYAQARNFTPDELDDAVIRLAELDHALKGGSTLPGELEFSARSSTSRAAETRASAAS